MKVINTSAVLGVKNFCEDIPAENLIDKPLAMEAEFSPGAQSIHHIHPNQDESYQVLSGTLDLFLDNQWYSVGAGQSLSIPKGRVHAFRNSTNEIARVINTHNPGLRFQEYLEVLERLIRDGKVTNMTGLKSFIYMSLHALEFRNEVVAVQPPNWLIRVLAGIGRLLGYNL